MDVHDFFEGALREREMVAKGAKESDLDSFAHGLECLAERIEHPWFKPMLFRAIVGKEATIAEALRSAIDWACGFDSNNISPCKVEYWEGRNKVTIDYDAKRDSNDEDAD